MSQDPFKTRVDRRTNTDLLMVVPTVALVTLSQIIRER